MLDSVTLERMKTYLVGGAVRDKLLGLPVADRDWVVVGETPEAMVAAGFKPVGKDFPVFLHPQTHEEYALARTERKTGPGYQGFQFNTDASVTLEQDLLRRDLTINAIAQGHENNLVDPFNGQQDIKSRVLRHVSPAFSEDPVRVLRVAKFMARFSNLGFEIADATLQLMRTMVDNGEIDNLVPERVWRELEASLSASVPSAFFTSLLNANALAPTMPELDEALRLPTTNASENVTNHRAIISHPMLDALDAACKLSDSRCVRFAAFCAGFSSARAPKLESFCQRLRVPAKFAELAVLSARHTINAHQALALDADQLHTLLKSLDAIRRPERFNDFLSAAQANAIANTDEITNYSGINNPAVSNRDFPQSARLRACAQAMGSIDAALIAKRQPNKTTISTAIKQHEIEAINTYLSTM